MRSSPFPTPLLHALHVARLVGASPIEYVLGRVLNPAVRRIAPSSRHESCSRQAQLAQSVQLYQSLGSTSAIVRYAVRISGSAIAAVLSSSAATYFTTMRGN